MKIGMFYQVLDSAVKNNDVQSIDSGIEQLRELGISSFTMNMDLFPTTKDENFALSGILSKGLSVQTCYFREKIAGLDGSSMAMSIEHAKIKVEQCARFHSKRLMPIVVCEEKAKPGTIDDLAWLTEYLGRVSEIAARYGVGVSVENSGYPSVLLQSASEVEYVLSLNDAIGHIADIGNYWLTDNENDVKLMVDRFSSRISGVHIKDVLPGQRGRYLVNGQRVDFPPLGSGIVPVAEIVKTIISRECRCDFTIEVDGYQNGFEKICASLSYLKSEIDWISR